MYTITVISVGDDPFEYLKVDLTGIENEPTLDVIEEAEEKIKNQFEKLFKYNPRQTVSIAYED